MPRSVKNSAKNSIIDTTEILPEQLPAGLLEQMEGWHATLSTITVQYEWTPRRWRQVNEQLSLGAPPPQQSAPELCLTVVHMMHAAHIKWPGNSEPPERYRVRAGLKVDGEDRLRYRTHMLEPDYGPDGELVFVDAGEEAAHERTAIHVATQAYDHAAQVSLRCLDAVGNTMGKILSMAEAVQKMAEGSAQLAANSAEGLAKVIKAEGEIRKEEREHEEEMQRLEMWGRIGEQFAGPIAAQFASLFVANMANAGQKSGGEPLAKRLAKIKRKAGKRWAAMEGHLTSDEKSILSQLAGAGDDATFLAIFAKLSESWDVSRLQELLPKIEEALGNELAQELAAIIMEASARAGVA